MDRKEKFFQLELERFKQKASWENKMFYTFLVIILSIIIITLNETEKFLNLRTIIWILVLCAFLIFGEFLINRYLDNQKDKIVKETK